MTVNVKTYGLASDPKGMPFSMTWNGALPLLSGSKIGCCAFKALSAASPLLPCRDAEANSCLPSVL